MPTATEEMNFKQIYLNLNDHMLLVAIILDNTVLYNEFCIMNSLH